MEGFPTSKGSWPWPWPWIRSYCIPSCISHRPLPTCQISLKSKKLFVNGWTYCRTDGNLRPTLWGRLRRVDLIINMHTMNREITSCRKRGFDGVLYKMWPLLTPWSAVSMLLAALRELKQIDLAGRWLVQHTAPVRAKPDSRPLLQGVH